MTFDDLMIAQDATPEERLACVHFLARRRARRTVESLLPHRRCFTYCGDDACTCDARPPDELVVRDEH